MKGILLVLFGGLVWMWRGSRYCLPGYLGSLATAILMIYPISYLYGINIIKCLPAILVLTIIEGAIGYGALTDYLNVMPTFTNPLEKEVWVCLGLISLCYCLLPFLFMVQKVNQLQLVITILIGIIAMPLAKYVDLYLKGCNTTMDTWKVAEFIIGALIQLSWLTKMIK